MFSDTTEETGPRSIDIGSRKGLMSKPPVYKKEAAIANLRVEIIWFALPRAPSDTWRPALSGDEEAQEHSG